jgi:hypothetical protein
MMGLSILLKFTRPGGNYEEILGVCAKSTSG